MPSYYVSKARRWWLAGTLAFACGASLVIGTWRSCPAELAGPTVADRNVTKIVTELMKQRHLSQRPLDDEISARAFKLFIEGFDPLKVYFYQSDIDEFSKYKTQLDDMLKRSDTSFAFIVFKRFLQRVDERVALIDQLLDGMFDFTQDEDMVTDPDLLHFPRTPEEAHDRWRKRIKYDLLVLEAGKEAAKDAEKKVITKKKDKEPREQLRERYHGFELRMHQFDNDELLETFLTAVTTSFDPHTTYMSADTDKNFRIALSLGLDGIGAQLQDNNGKCVVAKIIQGGAADKGGQLKEDDQIVSVGQDEDGEMVDVVGMKLTNVVEKIRGKAGTIVRLGVLPATGGPVVTYTITRAKIELKDEEAAGKLFEAGKKPNGNPFKVGVIDLHSFYLDMQAARRRDPNYRSSTRDVRRILDDFKQQNVDGVVLDLRRNGGGSLIEAINLTGLFIDRGPVVQVMGAEDTKPEHYDDMDRGEVWSGPLVVLISKFSASASEILAGAIQDYKRGLIIGDESTHGKGTVQSLLDLGEELIPGRNPPKLGSLKITMQQFFRPNGDSTQKRGVLSDIVLPSVTSYMDVGESDLDYAIPFRHVQPTDFTPTNMVNPRIVEELKTKVDQRLDHSHSFAKALKRIELYRKQKARKSVTLNEKKFMAERAEMNAQKEDEKQIEKQASGESTIQRDYYLNEVFDILDDYITILDQSKIAKMSY